MTTIEIIFSVISGIISSIIIGVFLHFREERRWGKVKKHFMSHLRTHPSMTQYYIVSILNIEVIDDEDQLIENKDLIETINLMPIRNEQYKELARIFRSIRDKVETLRAQALVIPTFSSEDFHSVDTDLRVIDSYLQKVTFYIPIEEDDPEYHELHKDLKKSLISMLTPTPNIN